MTEAIRARITRLLKEGNWSEARTELLRQLRVSPNDPWLLTRLSKAYFEEGHFEKALDVSKKAVSITKDDPLVLWDYAQALYMMSQFAESINVYRALLKKKPEVISRKTRWSKKKAEDFKNTCRFKIGLCYVQLDELTLAIKWFKRVLANQVSGIRKYYSAAFVKSKLAELEKLIQALKEKRLMVWVSLLEIEDIRNGTRVKCSKGFTNGLVLANSAKDAVAALRKTLLEMGYKLVAAEDTEEFERRCLKFPVEESLKKVAAVAAKENSPQFSDFCMYAPKK